jgi:hypothetical protein
MSRPIPTLVTQDLLLRPLAMEDAVGLHRISQ